MNKPNKFLFDLNNFDAPEEEEEIIEEIEAEPPPPTFSEDELATAKAMAHATGRTEGIQEEKESREQFVTDVLKTISDDFSTLFAAETYRERQYEEESLRLSLEVLDLLAPSLKTRLGEEALKNALKEILTKQSDQSEIRVEVHPDTANDIDKLIESIWADPDNAPRYKVVADNTLEKGACTLSWKDGGMIRKPDQTANDIKTAIEALLVEQVMSKGNSALTEDINNGIKNQQHAESGTTPGTEFDPADHDGDQE